MSSFTEKYKPHASSKGNVIFTIVVQNADSEHFYCVIIKNGKFNNDVILICMLVKYINMHVHLCICSVSLLPDLRNLIMNELVWGLAWCMQVIHV